MKDIFEIIKEKIGQALPGSEIKIADEAALHNEHGVTGAHVKLMVIYSGFEGMSLIKQHQKIYSILDEEMKSGAIHSLKLRTSSQ